LTLLVLLAGQLFVSSILPWRNRDEAPAASAPERELEGSEEPGTAREEPEPLVDDMHVVRDLVQELAKWNGAPPEHDAAAIPSTLAASPDTPGGEPEAHRDVHSTFDRQDGTPGVRSRDATTGRVAQEGSPDLRADELHRLLDAIEARALDVDSSVDPPPVAKHEALPPRVVEPDNPQLGARTYAGAVWRFRWLIPIALCAAILVPLLMLYRPVWPAGLQARATVSYVTKTQLLVDSPSGPFLRTETTPSGRSVAPVTPGPDTTSELGSSFSSDTKSLVDAANLFPLLMESDEVVAVRRKLIGDVPGTVRATALFANQGANRFRPSVLPLMQIIAAAPSPESAVELGEGTARAFRIWLVREQNRANVPAEERIVVRQLNQPSAPEKIGGPGYGMPILAGLAVLGAFFGLAVMLDRLLPRRGGSQPAATSAEAVPSVQGQVEAESEEPRASTRKSDPNSDSLSRISDVMREARAERPPG
jgi:hypothetical protein